MQKRCILCADPDPELRSNLGFLLAGENCVLEAAAGGATLLTQLRRSTDLVILPQQLPDMSGFDACTALRRQSAAPVLFLLEKADESARTLSFSVGGDDCLEKPVSCHELAVRVKALLRRYCVYGARPTGLERRLRCGGLEVDTAAGTVWQEGREVPLTELEYRIVLLLASYPNKIFSAENLYESIWEEPYFYSCKNTVMVHIRNIRQKVGSGAICTCGVRDIAWVRPIPDIPLSAGRLTVPPLLRKIKAENTAKRR